MKREDRQHCIRSFSVQQGQKIKPKITPGHPIPLWLKIHVVKPRATVNSSCEPHSKTSVKESSCSPSPPKNSTYSDSKNHLWWSLFVTAYFNSFFQFSRPQEYIRNGQIMNVIYFLLNGSRPRETLLIISAAEKSRNLFMCQSSRGWDGTLVLCSRSLGTSFMQESLAY